MGISVGGTQKVAMPTVVGPAEALETGADFLLDAKMTVDQLDTLKSDIMKLKNRLSAGGQTAQRAVQRLIELAMEPNAKIAMTMTGVPFSAVKLLKSEASSTSLKRLAATLVTLITDLPITSETMDVKTGAAGRLFIGVPRPGRVYSPDETILELEAGVQPSDTSSGDYLLKADVDA